MKPIKIINIVGARPQFIKYFPIAEYIKSMSNKKWEVIDILVHSGQHYDYNLSKVFFDEFGIREPDYHLGVGSDSQGKQTGEIIRKTEEILVNIKPDFVIIYGDTNTTLGAAIACSKLNIPLCHIEAGLRSFNKTMPEEINRIIADHISSVLFCPTKTAVKNLENEGFKNSYKNGDLISVDDKDEFKRLFSEVYINNPVIINSGDVMYDVVLKASEIASKKSKILEKLNLNAKEYILLTLHRAENTSNVMKLNELIEYVIENSKNKQIIFPVHPRTQNLYNELDAKLKEKIKAIEPLGYFDLIELLKNASMAFTDSGGLQKEAYWLGVPCVTMREETEWLETIESGWNVLYKNFNGKHYFNKSGKDDYGDGNASGRIIEVLTWL